MALTKQSITATKGVEVLRARPRDIRSWASLRHALWPHESRAALARELPRMLKNPRWGAWIAWEAGEALGFAEAYIRDYANSSDSQPVPFLEGIWVKQGRRKKGIGRLLLNAVEAWAKKGGFKELGSDALLKNKKSKKAHLAWGFQEIEKVVYFNKKLGKR